MTVDRMRGWLVPLVAACLVGFTALPASGQTVVTGKVTNTFGVPIPGTSVMISSLRVGGTANDSGVYSITISSDLARGQTVTATAKFIGYAPMSQSVTLSGGSHQLDFALKADPFQLNAIITTGVADSTSAKNLTFSAAKVTSAQIQTVPASDALSALTGKVAGVMVSPGTGTPGSTPTIRLRGTTCLSASSCNSPLIIIDGVITTESIADLDVSNIASMEVLKGAAGASFYGSNGANGVITITTKSGRDLAENHVSITAHGEYGQNGISHWPSFNRGTLDTFDASGAIILDAANNPVPSGSPFDDTPFPTAGPNRFRDQMKLWTKNNDFYNSDVSLGLRRGNTNFNTQYSSDHNGGIVPFRSGQFRQNVRLNIDQGISDKLDLSSSMTYGIQNISNGGDWFALYQAPPMIDLQHPDNPANDTTSFYPILPAWADGGSRGNPLYDLSYSSPFSQSQHFLGSLSARYHPTSWLRVEANYGTDRKDGRSESYTPRGKISTSSGLHSGQGSMSSSSYSDISWNSLVRASATKLYKSILSTTSVAYQLENSNNASFGASAGVLNVSGVVSLNAGNTDNLGVNSSGDIERSIDYTVMENLNYKDKYILDGLYRRDGSSLFGSDNRWKDFYRVAGAYHLTSDISIPGVQDLKLHVAQGTAGLRPGFSYQYETYGIGGGTFSKNTLGNKALTPAIMTETEYGINIDFLNRYTAEFTIANDKVDGAFLNVPLSSAANGGFSSQWQNAADIATKTYEGSFQTRIVDRRSVTWDLSLTADHTTQRIDHMSVAPYPVSAGGQGQGVFWYESGKDLGIIYGTQFAKTIDEAVSNHNPNFPSTSPADYVVNPTGYVVLAANRNKEAERPIALIDASGTTKFVIGNVNPDLNYGLSDDIRWNRFTFHTLLSGQLGGQVYNFSKQWRMQDLRAGEMDMTTTPDDQKIAQGFFSTGLYNGLDPSNYFVESGAYLKLQELSVGYDVSPRLLSTVGMGRVAGVRLSVLGRNVYTWTNYTGFDPDVTSGGNFNFKIDGFRYPPFRSFTGQIEVRF